MSVSLACLLQTVVCSCESALGDDHRVWEALSQSIDKA
jgi:hypothetical protein